MNNYTPEQIEEIKKAIQRSIMTFSFPPHGLKSLKAIGGLSFAEEEGALSLNKTEGGGLSIK